jgi:hypothetical protein
LKVSCNLSGGDIACGWWPAFLTALFFLVIVGNVVASFDHVTSLFFFLQSKHSRSQLHCPAVFSMETALILHYIIDALNECAAPQLVQQVLMHWHVKPKFIAHTHAHDFAFFTYTSRGTVSSSLPWHGSDDNTDRPLAGSRSWLSEKSRQAANMVGGIYHKLLACTP